MTVYIYASLDEYLCAEHHVSVDIMPLRIYGNCPFRFDILNKKLLITYDGKQVEEKYYSYETFTDKILIFKEF